MSWKETASGFLTFSRKDRVGVLVLIGLIILVYALPYLSPEKSKAPIPLNDSLLMAIDSLQKPAAGFAAKEDAQDYIFEPSSSSAFEENTLFVFDPNTLDAAGWRKLGVRDKTIKTIYNYRNKGGRFYKPEDVAKIWGLPKGFYERVKSHILIPTREKKFEITAFGERKIYEPRKLSVINMNTADSAAWVALPGIGPKLASRIINFKNKLGGFVSVEQIGTTYGLPDSTFQKIKPLLQADDRAILKININTATKEQLSNHPYINWKLANAVVAYREQHGTFTSIGDLKKIMILNDAAFEKIKPYLKTE